ncbi:DUF998 domain-containing protein [Antrihabitans sp. YC2-6]|uniref:DUF998 domain-containing protein n=1 Tax=Antrihabitans sp. YC2-6 TaxID=2799498 RepID=UPI0018F57490|nr:DUF998 domain-containing protein [Antrihabitans sp. YC2-6]MBJ8347753.1 DUF998 domain-containing protein [Antrihabitans sp. YC2-6]
MKNTLLGCGIVAGPLFALIWAAQATTRAGFDPGRHPISLLSLGDLGWIQITNFVVTGLLFTACAVGMRQTLLSGRGHVWGPRLVGSLGVGLIIAGVFVTDPGAGYPIGAPEGAPDHMSVHGIVHEIGFMLSVPAMTVGAIVFARRFKAAGELRWYRGALATAGAVLLLTMFPSPDGFAVRAVIATAILFGFVAALSARYIHENNRSLPLPQQHFAHN